MSLKNPTSPTATAPQKPTGTLGTFSGVFTPSILTILGIILFLRLGYVTGSAGVGRTLLILLIANLITIITSQSLAAISTNIKVKGGGDYYLISRTLGYKFGGSIGIVLYLAQSVSVAFYCIGFAEALSSMPFVTLSPAIIASLAISALFVLAWLGSDWATKFQYIVMVLLVLALGSFFIGGIQQWQPSIFLTNWTTPENSPPFWLIFAIFFPAVTGFTQGVSMSGDLKDPGKSLPSGTFAAVFFSIFIYLVVIVIFAGALPNELLRQDYQAMQHVSKYAFLIDAGVIAATLSSAMASFMGGPRILQSLAADRIFPILSPFAKGSGTTNNPRRGIILTSLIALLTISLGQLNLIAQIVSMFFLISYGLLNYATYFEADTGSTSFRPKFRFFHKYLSLIGCMLCLAVLLALDMNNGVIALAILLAIYLYLQHSKTPSRWADSTRSHAFSQARKNLIHMENVPEHQNDWYPHLLIFTSNRTNREKLLIFSEWMCGGTGLMTALQIIEAKGANCSKQKQVVLKELNEDIKNHNIFCFKQVIALNNFATDLPLILESRGMGPLQENTIVTNWYTTDNTLSDTKFLNFGTNLRTAQRYGYNLVVFHCDDSKWQTVTQEDGNRSRIDIWWQGDDNTSKLMLLFAYLITRNKLWDDAEIRVLTTGAGKNFSVAKENLMQIFDEARIPAEPHIVQNMNPETVLDHSKNSSLVFLPFRINNSRITDLQGLSFERILPQLPPTALIKASEIIDLDAEPEEGIAGDLAQATDDLRTADSRFQEAHQKQLKAADLVESLSNQLRDEAQQQPVDSLTEKATELQDDLYEAELRAKKLSRKAIKAKVKQEEVISLLQEIDVQPIEQKIP